jgi:hypothetical protein
MDEHKFQGQFDSKRQCLQQLSTKEVHNEISCAGT